MATIFLPSANSLLSSSSSSSSSSSQTPNYFHKGNVKRQLTQCKAVSDSPPNSLQIVSKRSLSISLTTSFLFSLASKDYFNANAAILEADDDEELLEKVKKDRKKRLDRQGVINSSNKEKAYLQDLVYKLSKVGQAIENNDLPTASSVLGQSTDTDWVQKVNAAFSKLSYGHEETTEVDTFNSSLASLISSVIKNDAEAAKVSFVSSASAFEKWITLTGLVGQLKGL